jgi:hypothetical protein
MKQLDLIVEDIRSGENVDIYLTILLCILVLVLDLFNLVQLEIVATAILLTLSLLSFGTLVTRRSLGNLNHAIQRMNEGEQAKIQLKTRNSYRPLEETIGQAQHVCFVGASLVNVFSQYARYIYTEKLKKQGAKIQVLVLDPNCSTVESAAKCLDSLPESLSVDINRTLSYVDKMMKDGVGAGAIEVRLAPASPNFSMVLLDPDKPEGKMFVEFIGYHSTIHMRPHLELTWKQEREWYEYFLQQYRELWEDSRAWAPEKK